MRSQDRTPREESPGLEHIELERTRIIEGKAGITHMHYRVKR